MNGLWLPVVCVGAAVLLVLASIRCAMVATSGRDEQSRDEAPRDEPPLWWRLTWPLVRSLECWPGGLLAQPGRKRLTERLWRAGLGHALTPEQFQAGRVLAALTAVALVLLALAPLGLLPVVPALCAACLGFFVPLSWLNDRVALKARKVLRDLPFYLDVLTLALESGLNLTSAMRQAIDKGPSGPLKVEFVKVMRDLRAGRSRAEALRMMADRLALSQVSSLVSALLTAERQGASLGVVLRAQAEQRRHERFMRAERLAMEAPVKMLFPLVLFIFPCTFLILFFPVVNRILQEGWIR